MRHENNEVEPEDYMANQEAYNIVDRHPRRASPFQVIAIVLGIYFLYHYISPVSFSVHTAIDKVEPAKLAPPQKIPNKASQQTTLHRAITAGKLDLLLELLQKDGAKNINQLENGMTPIMLAASKGNVDMIDLLYTHGADPNKRGSLERTALQYATEKNHYGAAKRLLSYGADIDAYDNSRLTPLTMAANRGFTELGLLYVEKGADVNIQHVQGWTALIRNDQRLVKALLDAGANRNIKMKNDMKAYDYAVQYKHREMIRLLSKKT